MTDSIQGTWYTLVLSQQIAYSGKTTTTTTTLQIQTLKRHAIFLNESLSP